MLCDPKIITTHMASILEQLTGDMSGPRRIDTGVYELNHFNFDAYLKDQLATDYPTFENIENMDLCPYGVCDSPNQFLSLFGNDLQTSAKKYCISFTCISRADQPTHGGWRWHKWGPYVGMHTPTTEYLYDEPDIKEVFVYHVHELR